jgi:hypothetical protein
MPAIHDLLGCCWACGAPAVIALAYTRERSRQTIWMLGCCFNQAATVVSRSSGSSAIVWRRTRSTTMVPIDCPVPHDQSSMPTIIDRGGELTTEQQEYNRAINAVRVRVEHCIGWAKNWRILATQFRCSHTIYTSVMQAVCGFVNLQTQRWQAAKQAEAAYCA